MAKKSSVNKNQILIDFLAVVFAVLLALLLNSWRESIVTKNNLKKVISNIQIEIENNNARITKALVYHDSLISDLNSNQHVVMSVPLSFFPIDISNDIQLEGYLRNVIPFSQIRAINRLEVKSLDEERILVLNEIVMRIHTIDERLIIYGPTNIKLRNANISNRSWEIAQATNVLVEMDIAIVDALSKVYTLVSEYENTCSIAIQMVYKGEPEIIFVLEDMATLEREILENNKLLLELLEEGND